jgi:hypothetical protein
MKKKAHGCKPWAWRLGLRGDVMAVAWIPAPLRDLTGGRDTVTVSPDVTDLITPVVDLGADQ